MRQGLVTKSDALLASVRAGDVDAQLAEAEGAAATARRQLAVLLGRDGGDLPNDLIAATHLPPTERIRAEVAGDTVARPAEPRADVRAATDAQAAARGDALRAKASLLPRLNGFARYDWNSPTGLYSGDRNWTVGVMASWSPFAGASELADVEATAGRAQAAQAQAEAARANARLEIEQTRTALSVALTRLDIAEHAAAQSAEAHRIVSRKYERRPCRSGRAARRTSGRDAERARAVAGPLGRDRRGGRTAPRAWSRPGDARVARRHEHRGRARRANRPLIHRTPYQRIQRP